MAAMSKQPTVTFNLHRSLRFRLYVLPAALPLLFTPMTLPVTPAIMSSLKRAADYPCSYMLIAFITTLRRHLAMKMAAEFKLI